jgi:lipopolysaccharide cholinephosphotransferase
MEMNTADSAKYKELLLQTTKDFIKFCDDNGLIYYASDGTALGAIRHHGMIPWDDDVDVLMPYRDFVKFIKLRNKLANTEYEILYDETPNYPLPFAKFCNRNITIWERKDLPCLYGAFVDIFPMFEVNDSEETEKKFNIHRDSFYRFSESRKLFYFSDWFSLLRQKRLKLFLKQPIFHFYCRLKASSAYARYKEVETSIEILNGSNYLSMSGISSYKRQTYSKDWFEEGVIMPFENLSIRLPKKYDAYLTHMFGDYMTPPPLKEQVSHHYLYFYDLTKKLSIDECRKAIRKMDSALFKERNCTWYQYE